MVPEYFKSISKRLLLLVELEATEFEIQDCLSIFKYVRQTEKDNISFDTVGSLCFNATDIPVNQIHFIRKMLSHGYCELSGAQVVFKKRELNEKNISDFIIQLENRYRSLSSAAGKKHINFPPSQFSTVAPQFLKEINVNREFLGDLNTDTIEDKLFEISFDRQGIPKFFLPKNVLGNLREICLTNIVYRLAEYAEENEEFYTNIIMVYKRQFAGRDREALERDLAGITAKNEQENRKKGTEKIMTKILYHEKIGRSCLKHLLNDNTYVFTRFNIENINDLDFFQSIYTLESFYTSQGEKEEVTAVTLMRYVKETASFFLTKEELYACMLLEKPKLTEGQQDLAFNRFIGELVERSGKITFPSIIRTSNRNGTRTEEVFIHKDNMDFFLEHELNKAKRNLPSIIQENWKNNIRNLHLVPAMISTTLFRDVIWHHLESEHFILFQLIRNGGELENPEFHDFLSSFESVGKNTRLFLTHGSNEIEKVLRLDKNILYDKTMGIVLHDLNPFVRFFFLIRHWFKKRRLLTENRELLEREPKSSIPEKSSSTGKLPELEIAETDGGSGGLFYRDALFSHAGIKSFPELKARLKDLRADMSEDIPDTGSLMHSILSSISLGSTITYAAIIEAYNAQTSRLIERYPGLEYNPSFKKYMLLMVFRVVSDNRLDLEEGKPKALANALPVFQSILGSPH